MTSFAVTKLTAVSAHFANVMLGLQEIMLLRRMCSILNSTCFGVQMTVELCGSRRITVHGDLVAHGHQSKGYLLQLQCSSKSTVDRL